VFFVSWIFPLSIIFEQSWQLREVADDRREAKVTLMFKKVGEDPGNYRPVSLTLIPGKVMKQLILGTVSSHMKNKKVHQEQSAWPHQGEVTLDKLGNLLR